MALLSGVEAQVSLTMAFSSSAFFCLLFLIFLLTMGFTKFQGFHYHDVKWAFLEVLGKRPLSKKKKKEEVTDHAQNAVCFCAGISNPRISSDG